MSFVATDAALSWGRVARGTQLLARPRFGDELPALVAPGGDRALICGLRRSYGDTCLNRGGRLIDATGLDRVIAFDAATGVLRAEAGLPLSDLLRLTVPHGWFVPTTPGSRFVTLGGAVANDVHGKNHHRAGSFGRHVRALGLRRTDGSAHDLAPGDALFAATVGGLGLTGVIEWVEIGLVPITSAWLDVETIPFGRLDEFWDIAAASTASHEHTVAWIDTLTAGAGLGRGIFSRADWATVGNLAPHDDAAMKNLPVELPAAAMGRASVRAFNALYWRAGRARAGRARQHYAPFFYPLDAVGQWNRAYGSAGMYQYQCVVPPGSERDAVPALLGEIARAGQGSFLAVLKTMGSLPSPGLVSFARAGTTLALDLPNRGADTVALMGRLDDVVAAAGGALYPAKDGRMTAAMFRASFPRWAEFDRLRDPGMGSDFWDRVSA